MNFASNPIITTVTAGTFPQDSTNQRIVVEVTISGKVYEFPHSAESGKTYTIDISSAYRAELARCTMPTPSSPTSPTVTGALTARGECVKDGVVVNNISCTTSGGNVTARLGGYTDIERISGTTAAPSLLSTKPNLVEVVGVGEKIQLGNQSLTAVAGSKDHVISGRKYYGEANPNRHTLYFLNRYGEIETASLVTLESLGVNVTNTTIQQVRAPQSAAYARKRTYHTGGANSWKMSSGYMEREWLSWFAHDVMLSGHYWLQTQKGIIPVLVSAGDSMDIYNKADGSLKAINITVTSAMEGEVEL